MFEKPDSKGNTYTIPCDGILTESGILLENGETITEGKVVELARKLSRLWHAKEWRKFMEGCRQWIHEFNDEDYYLLRNTVINERGDTVHWAMIDITDFLEDMKDMLDTPVND